MKSRTVLIWILVLVLCPISVFASSLTRTERENLYKSAMDELEAYLRANRDDAATLAGIISSFDQSLEGYSEYLKDYATVLQIIAEESYASKEFEMNLMLSSMHYNKLFTDFLSGLKDSSIRPLDELEAYAEGRKAQYYGDNEAAAQAYKRCMSFFDAYTRYKELMSESSDNLYQEGVRILQQGDYAGAYFMFMDAAGYSDSSKRARDIVNLLGYTPKDSQDNLQPVGNLQCQRVTQNNATLGWEMSSHATEYEVSFRKKGSANWTVYQTTEETSMTIEGLSEGTTYDFRVVACIGKYARSLETVLENVSVKTGLMPITPASGSNPNLLDNSEAERKSSGGFIGVEVYQALQAYVGQTVTISFDLKASESQNLRIYAYQNSGVSIAESFSVQPTEEYQRYGFTTTVKDYGYDDPKLTKGTMGIYDSSKTSGLTFSVRRIKIELGTQATAWSLSAKDSATPVPTKAPTPQPTTAPSPTQTPRPQSTAHVHTWNSADCTHPKTCIVCGATEGSALGHNWKDATCTTAKTCTRCGQTQGSALGHNWKDATCTTAKTCTRCGQTQGSALGHGWMDATCEYPQYCWRCGETKGSALGHNWQPATEYAPKTCSRCGATSGSPLTWSAWSEWSDTPVTASSTRQVETRTVYYYHRWHYYNTVKKAWYNHYSEYTGSQYKPGSGEWLYYTSTEELPYQGVVDGHKYYGGNYWYLQGTGTQYRYRELR